VKDCGEIVSDPNADTRAAPVTWYATDPVEKRGRIGRYERTVRSAKALSHAMVFVMIRAASSLVNTSQ
jgi:hypothetical protein